MVKMYFTEKKDLAYFQKNWPDAFKDEPEKKPLGAPNQLEQKKESAVNPPVVTSEIATAKSQMMSLIDTLLDNGISNTSKKKYLDTLKKNIQDKNFTNEAELKNAARNVFLLALQRTCFGFTNTSNSGLKIRELLNDPAYGDLKQLLFPKASVVKYRDLRTFVVGANLDKVFSSTNRSNMFSLFGKINENTHHKSILVSDEDIKETLTNPPSSRWKCCF